MAEPVRTLSARGSATRRRLLDAACSELVEAGGHLEIAALARRLGASPALLYRYFGAKDGLVAAVVEEFYDEYEAAVFLTAGEAQGHVDVGDWQSRELARIGREVDFLYSHPMARAVVARQLQEPAASHVDARRVAAQIDVAAENVARGQREGAVADDVEPRLAAAAYIGAFREVVGEALRRPHPPPQTAVVRMMIAVGNAIVPPPSTAPARSSRMT